MPSQTLQLSAGAMLHFQTMKQRPVTADKVKIWCHATALRRNVQPEFQGHLFQYLKAYSHSWQQSPLNLYVLFFTAFLCVHRCSSAVTSVFKAFNRR
jgi:hypothetical protein